MKQIFLFFILLLPVCAFSQLNESFNGPEISSTYPWKGETNLFKINEKKELQLYDTPNQRSASIFISSNYQLNNEWRCTLRSDYQGTTKNYFKLFLFCQNPNPDFPGKALFIRLGYSKKNLSVCYQNTYKEKPEVIYNGRVLCEDAIEVDIKVTSNSQGIYTIYSKTAKEKEYVKECTIEMWNYDQKGFFMISCYYSKEHSQDKYIDDVYIKQFSNEPSSETEPDEPDEQEPNIPLLRTVIEDEDNAMTLIFDREINPEQAIVSLSGQKAYQLNLSSDLQTLNAVWQDIRIKDKAYELCYNGIYSLEGKNNGESKGCFTFYSSMGESSEETLPEEEQPNEEEAQEETPGETPSDKEPTDKDQPDESEQPEILDKPEEATAIAPGAVIINEILAKPGDSQYPEYIELYNTTTTPLSLKGCIFQNGNKQKELPEVTLPADSYALLYHTDKQMTASPGAILIPIAAFPALNDNGKTLQLKNPSGSLIDEVTFPKAQSGISWERSDDSWHYCSDNNGGTPGASNSPEKKQPEKPEEEKPEKPVQPDTPDKEEESEQSEKPVNPNPPETQITPDGSDIYPREIIFNELLPNPANGGSEYIELYNRSKRTISIAGLSIATRKTDGSLSTHYSLSSITDLIEPGGYVVVSKNIDGVSSFFLIKSPTSLYELKLPILANTSSNLVLFRSGDKTVIDEVKYSVKWHATSIKDEKGVALERIHKDNPTQDPSNWTSAAKESGYGTPGYENSQAAREEAGNITSIEPPVFSDLTGEYTISYYLDQAGYNCRAFIYSTVGRKVAEIANHELMGTRGELTWNGNDNNGNRLSPGIYIIYIELYHPQGAVKRFKKVFLCR